jgi:hypothetical protein
MVKVAVAAAAVLLVGAQEAEPAIFTAEWDKYIEEVGVLAYVFGYCERLMPPEPAAAFTRKLADIPRGPVLDMVRGVYFSSYASGKQYALEVPPAEDRCVSALDETSAAIDRAEAALEEAQASDLPRAQ